MATPKIQSVKVKLAGVRILWPHLHVPHSVMDSEPKYSITVLLDKEKDADKIEMLRGHVRSIMQQMGGKLSAEKICVKDGDETDKEWAANQVYIAPKSKTAPICLDKAKTRITEADKSPIYSGCRANVVLELWAQDNQYGKRINAALIGVMFHSDDEPYGGSGGGSINDFAEFESDGDDIF